MTKEEYDNLEFTDQVDAVLDRYDDDLNEECYCRFIGNPHERAKYTITIDQISNPTEILVCDMEEQDVELQDVLDEFGVYDWSDLPMRKAGCHDCPCRYDCETVMDNMKVFEQQELDDEEE